MRQSPSPRPAALRATAALAFGALTVAGCTADSLPGAGDADDRTGDMPPLLADAGMPMPCGDGVLDTAEACDDGNSAAGDGCSSLCQVEEGYECLTPGAPCTLLPRCGDGRVDPGEGEVCDDGNADGGDGCARDCALVERYFTCPPGGGVCSRVPFDEVLSAGLDGYLGSTRPDLAVDIRNGTYYTWTERGGPRCRVGPFRTAVRDLGSEDLVIFFPGGGICSRETGPLCMPTSLFGTVGGDGVLDYDNPENPFAGWNASQIAYCDGSILAGDRGNQTGLLNLSAGLDVTKDRFPNPRRILLAGSSGGAYGTFTAVALVRHLYPDAEILVVNDAGFGLGRPDDPDFVGRVAAELGFDDFLDAACETARDYTDCETSAHASWMTEYALEEDENLRFATISSYGDIVIGGVFLRQYGFLLPWETAGLLFNTRNHTRGFGDALTGEVRRISDRYPQRFAGFLYNGFGHVLIGQGVEYPPILAPVAGLLQGVIQPNYYTARVERTRLTDWLDAALNAPADWRTVEQDP